MANAFFRLDRKLLGDTAWNYGAFAMMASTGVILSFFIAIQYGLETLGVFNQIYAVYIVAAQLAVFGLHDSAQKYTAEYHGQIDILHQIARSAIFLAFIIGAAIALIIYLAAPSIGLIVDSMQVGLGVAWAAPGLFFFAINKVLLGILNGQRRMREFAIMQGLRVLTILGFVLFAAENDWPGYILGASFTVAELVIFCPLLILVRPWQGNSDIQRIKYWCHRLLDFGAKALPNGFLAESYLRVDILILAIFASDEAIGVYSFAALFIEGLYQITAAIRVVINPVLVQLIKTGEKKHLAEFGRRIMTMCLSIFIPAIALTVCIFPHLNPFFPDDLISRAFPILVILSCGLALYAAFIPLDFILMQAGQPGWQSCLMSFNILTNIILNASLIPFYGIEGAALATAVAFAFSGINLNLAVWWRLGLRGGLLLAETRFIKPSTLSEKCR